MATAAVSTTDHDQEREEFLKNSEHLKELLGSDVKNILINIYKKTLSGQALNQQEVKDVVDLAQRTGGVLTLSEEAKYNGVQIFLTPKVSENIEGKPSLNITFDTNKSGEKVVFINFPMTQFQFDCLARYGSDTIIWSATHNELLPERVAGLTKEFSDLAEANPASLSSTEIQIMEMVLRNRNQLPDESEKASLLSVQQAYMKSLAGMPLTEWEMLNVVKAGHDQAFDRYDEATVKLFELINEQELELDSIRVCALDQVVLGGKDRVDYQSLTDTKVESYIDWHSGQMPFEASDYSITTPTGGQSFYNHPLIHGVYQDMARYDLPTFHIGEEEKEDGSITKGIKAKYYRQNCAFLGIPPNDNQYVLTIQRGINSQTKRRLVLEANSADEAVEDVQKFIDETKESGKKLVYTGGRAVPYKDPLNSLKQIVRFIEENPHGLGDDTNFLVLLGSTRLKTPGQPEYQQEIQDYYNSLPEEVQDKVYLRIGQSYDPGNYAKFMTQADVFLQTVAENTQEGFGLQALEAMAVGNVFGYHQDAAEAVQADFIDFMHRAVVAKMQGESAYQVHFSQAEERAYPFELDLREIGAYGQLAVTSLAATVRKMSDHQVILPFDPMKEFLNKAIVSVEPGMGMAEAYKDGMFNCNSTADVPEALTLALTASEQEKASRMSLFIQQVEGVTGEHYGNLVNSFFAERAELAG